jgi:hypothetical protein
MRVSESSSLRHSNERYLPLQEIGSVYYVVASRTFKAIWIVIFYHSVLQKSIDKMDKNFSMKAKSMNNKRQSSREYLPTYLNKMSAKGVS